MGTQRFRRSSAISVAAAIVMISGISLANWAPPWSLAVLVIPFAVAVWAWRAGTDVDPDGLTVRAAVGSRRIPWSGVSGLVTDPRGRVSVALTSGNELALPAVSAADLPRLLAAAGQPPQPQQPAEPSE